MSIEQGGTIRWSVAQIWSKRAHRIVEQLQASERGTFTPTYDRRWFVDGKISTKTSALLPGYVLFEVDTETWGEVAEIEGVIRVLSKGLPISDSENIRLTLGHAMNEYDALEAFPAAVGPPQRRRRRSRPSKKARMRAAARRAVEVRT